MVIPALRVFQPSSRLVCIICCLDSHFPAAECLSATCLRAMTNSRAKSAHPGAYSSMCDRRLGRGLHNLLSHPAAILGNTPLALVSCQDAGRIPQGGSAALCHNFGDNLDCSLVQDGFPSPLLCELHVSAASSHHHQHHHLGQSDSRRSLR